MKTKKLLLTIILQLAFVIMNQFANAQGHHGNVSCNCTQAGWGCLTLEYTCRMYCYSFCLDYCSKHPNKCARMSASSIIEETSLTDIFPNPISHSTTISFSVKQSTNISLKIFDMNGSLVSILADGSFEEGDNEIVWNVDDVIPGIYFLQFQSAETFQTEKLIVTK